MEAIEEFYIPKLTRKIENVIANCVPYILGNKKRGVLLDVITRRFS